MALKWLRQTWRRWQRWRQQRAPDIPTPLWNQVLARHPFVADRPTTELATLRWLCSHFLADKEFHGTQGLVVSDTVALTVALQACLPLVHWGRDGLRWYDDFVGIVIHPDTVVARREVVDDAGVVHHYREALSGEAMPGGPVMLSWRDVRTSGRSAADGYNVVIHEFAHVLDMADGMADGVPLLPPDLPRNQWCALLDSEYEAFAARVEREEPTALDPYGATAPEEFFAVASESFFVDPLSLRAEHAALYELFRNYYGQDPVSDLPAKVLNRP